MKVSIIVPVYNAEKYLKACLDSLVSQTLDDYEIILINDGSKDSSQRIIEEYKNRYPELINALTVENGGQGRARNIGMELAKGEYLGFADSDDWVEPSMFQLLYDTALAEEADVVVCDAVECHEDGSTVYLPMSTFKEPVKITTAVWNKLFKKSAVGSIRFPEGLWYEDLSFVMQFVLKTERVARVPQGLYYYRCGQVSTMNNNNALKNLDIIDIVEGLKAFLLPRGFRQEFEAVLLDHLLLDTINRVNAQSAENKEAVIGRLRGYAKENIPRLSASAAYKKEPWRRKIVMFLNYHGLHPLAKLLFKAKRMA